MTELLSVEGLRVSFPTDDGLVRAVDDVSFTLNAGETVAIVGESGSGKTVTSLSIMDLHNRKNADVSGSIKIRDGANTVDVVSASPEQTRDLRGRVVSMIFQDPMSSLHPYYKISNQLCESYLVHHPRQKKAALDKAISMLELVGISNPEKRALDVTVQAQILALLGDLQKKLNMGIVLITHDLGVVAQVSDRVNVMYAGKIVESGSVDDIFYRPLAPYTLGLLNSIPRAGDKKTGRLSAIAGQPPSMINLPTGCSFAPRCEFKDKVAGGLCASAMPDLIGISQDHRTRCHLDEKERAKLFPTLAVK